MNTARVSVDGYVPYEDIQRNLESKATEVSVPDPDSSPFLCKRADSLPQLPSETTQAMKAGDIAQLGGFRREHLHRNGRTDVRQTLMSSSDDSVVTGLSRRESGQLVSSIKRHTSHMVSFYISLDDADTRHELFGNNMGTTSQVGLSNFRTRITILKAFVSTGVLYLPNAFGFGGGLISVLLLFFMGGASIVGLLLLSDCHEVRPSSYPELGRIAYGDFAYVSIAIMVVLSQFAFCMSNHVLIARSLAELFRDAGLPLALFYFGQLAVFIPLGWIRRVQKMQFTMMLGNALIICGLVTISAYAITKISKDGVHDGAVLYSPRWTAFIGTSVYAFEGIGVAIPIREAMLRPQDFKHVMSTTVVFIAGMLASFGFVGYLAYGPEVDPVILNEIPPGFVQRTLVLVYVVAVVCVYPITIFPTYTIVEQRIFAGFPFSNTRRWLKNLYRTTVSIIGVAIAFYVGPSIEIFVSMVGVVFAIPLALLLPPLLHLRFFPGQRVITAILLIVIGTVCTVVCLQQNLKLIQT
jgi:amino acid permease